MCIAILNQNEELSLEIIQTCFHANPDGSGIMWAAKKGKTSELRTFKTFSLHQLYRAYLEAREEAINETIVLHFRIGTQGRLSDDNIHPFISQGGRMGFVHNGILRNFSQARYRKTPFSDTWHFNNTIVELLPKDFMRSVDKQRKLQQYITQNGYNKMIFMDKFGRTCILNEHLGEWVNGTWYSNDSYQGRNRYAGGYLIK